MDLGNMKVGGDLAAIKHKIKKVFFYRICGTGMGACACLAKEAGYEVAGADSSFAPPMSTYLESQEIELYKLDSLTKEKLQEFDLIVVGNSVPRMSENARFVENAGVAFTSFPSFLGEFVLKDKEVIGIAGTHGKTTTTYFLTQMLEHLGEKPGYLVGGIIEGRAPSHIGDKYFIIESDEYDSCYFQKISKFRLYELDHMILTSLEFDHADIFNSIEDIKKEFAATLHDFKGQIIANDDYSAIAELKESFPEKKWSFYGKKTEDGPFNILINESGSLFSLALNGERVDFKTNVIGEHNVLNISSSVVMLNRLGFANEALKECVLELAMVKRRQEVRGVYKEAIVIDDFAHHPKAIRLTLDAIKKKYPDKKIITVFEPVSATARSSLFQNEFVSSFNCSDTVIIAANSMATTVKDSKNLDCVKLVEDLNNKGQDAYNVTDLNGLLEIINSVVNSQSILLILSNRTCLGLWESDFAKNL